MKEWNGYNWSSFETNKHERYPKGPHFVVIVFGTNSEYQEGWHGERGSYVSVPCTKVYTFTDKKDLHNMIEEITKTDAKFVFYEVTKLGKTTITIDIETV